jgi:hypothetical protein
MQRRGGRKKKPERTDISLSLSLSLSLSHAHSLSFSPSSIGLRSVFVRLQPRPNVNYRWLMDTYRRKSFYARKLQTRADDERKSSSDVNYNIAYCSCRARGRITCAPQPLDLNISFSNTIGKRRAHGHLCVNRRRKSTCNTRTYRVHNHRGFSINEQNCFCAREQISFSDVVRAHTFTGLVLTVFTRARSLVFGWSPKVTREKKKMKKCERNKTIFNRARYSLRIPIRPLHHGPRYPKRYTTRCAPVHVDRTWTFVAAHARESNAKIVHPRRSINVCNLSSD